MIGEQGDELLALRREGRLVADAGDEVAGEVAVRGGRRFYGGDDRGVHLTAAWAEADRLTGGTESDFPGFLVVVVAFYDPWVALHEVGCARDGCGDLEVGRGVGDEIAEADLGIVSMFDKEACDIGADEVHAIEISLSVESAAVVFVPVLIALAHEHGELEVEVGAYAIDAGTGVAHAADD